MNITIKATKFTLRPETEKVLEDKLAAPMRIWGREGGKTLLEIDVEEAPPQGRSSEPVRLVARLTVDGKVFHAEAVKPTPESAADKVRSELESELRTVRGRSMNRWKRGGAKIKELLRFGR